MVYMLRKILILTVSVIVGAFIFPGITISSIWAALLVGVVLVLLNTFVKPILYILTFPITIITLGLFLLVVNALIIQLADAIVPGFEVDGFWWAVLFSLFYSFIAWLVDDKKNEG